MVNPAPPPAGTLELAYAPLNSVPVGSPPNPAPEPPGSDGYRWHLAGLGLVSLLDLGSALWLLRAAATDDHWDFQQGTADVLALCLIRLTALAGLGLLAVAPCLAPTGPDPAGCTHDVETGACAHEETAAIPACVQHKHRRTAALGALFALSTAAQVYVGAKCVGFQFGAGREEWLVGPLLGLAVVWINSEAWLLKVLVEKATSDKGQMFANLHQHGLVWKDGLSQRKCNLCSTQIRGKAREAWVCTKGCPFAVCPRCIALHSDHKEKQLRGDSGAKQEIVVSNKAYFLKALTFARPHWVLFALAFTFLALANGASMVLPAVQGHILDSIISHDRSGFRFYVECMVGLSVAVGLFGGLRGLFFSLATRRMAVSVRNMLFGQIVAQDVAFFDGTTVGDLTSRLNGDVQAMVSPCQRSLQSLMSNSLTLAGGLVMCFWTSWRLSMLAFSAIMPIVFLTEQYAKWSSEINKQIRTDLGDASNVAVEALSNIRTVKMFSTEQLEQDKYEEWTLAALSKSVRDAVGGACTAALNNYLDLGAGVIILLCGGAMAMNGQHVTVGDLITFQLYWSRMQGAIKGLNDIMMSFTRAAGAAQRVLSLVSNIPDINSTEGEELPAVQGDVEFRDVEFFYQLRPDQPVLDGLNLNVCQGQVTAMVGPSGGGKSTVLHLLMRLYNPTEGQILLDGRELSSLCLRDVHKHVCLVSQDPQLFGGSIMENISYGIEPPPPYEEVARAAQLAHAHEFISKMENGYDTRVGERGVRLSGGQRQRIAIARVLLRRPKVLVVAHRLSTVVNADKIVVLEAGKAVEVGTHKELLDRGGVYKRLVSKQLLASASIDKRDLHVVHSG